MSDSTPDDTAVKQDEQTDFNWWVTMLPFLALIGWFIYQWSRDFHNLMPLLYAAGALVLGLIVGALVEAGGGNAAEGDTTGGAKS
jgi:hypothetical protein